MTITIRSIAILRTMQLDDTENSARLLSLARETQHKFDEKNVFTRRIRARIPWTVNDVVANGVGGSVARVMTNGVSGSVSEVMVNGVSRSVTQVQANGVMANDVSGSAAQVMTNGVSGSVPEIGVNGLSRSVHRFRQTIFHGGELKKVMEKRLRFGFFEIMLQQTRVQTVVSYFDKWMAKWRSVHHLALTSIEEVNEMWAGLGYYRRARFLLEGAKMVVKEGGQFPRSVNDLCKVKGIGEYTAGAIASIAFNEAVLVVDGNVVRVIARLKTISANPKDKETVKSIWKLAGQLVDPHRPGDFNQTLMELGATLCTPLSPSSSCPISTHCSALSESNRSTSTLVTDYPTKVAKVKQRHDFSAISVVEILEGEEGTEYTSDSTSKIFLVKRPEEGLLAGLWDLQPGPEV
ncbi:adenine DNA glycosylase [Tanacetum coccineum]|uniref:Adenine DNA glycosylase n=1 Tax=Tanacetum coccineum TaxID=301880 RepID=A0ABQ5BYQ3_9ASTR